MRLRGSARVRFERPKRRPAPAARVRQRTGAGVMLLACSLLPLSAVAVDYGALPDLIDRIKPSVVGVGTQNPLNAPPNELLGTGFAVGDGLSIVTNHHVLPKKHKLADSEDIVVFVGTGREPEVRKVVRVTDDQGHDLAILRIDGKPLPTLTIGASSRVREGLSIGFTGFPIGAVLGLYPVTHTGIVSAITPIVIPVRRGRQLTAEQVLLLRDPYDVLQLDATAYPGNSGSPLFRLDTGEVVGIINRVFVKGKKEHVLRNPSAITYAIPSKYIETLLKK